MLGCIHSRIASLLSELFNNILAIKELQTKVFPVPVQKVGKAFPNGRNQCWERNICSIVYWLFVCVQCTSKRVTNTENGVCAVPLNDFGLLLMEKALHYILVRFCKFYRAGLRNSNSSTFAKDIHSECHCQKCITELKLNAINIICYMPNEANGQFLCT